MIIDLNRERAKDKIKLVIALVLWTLILVTIYSLIKGYEYKTRVEFERESEQVEFEMNKVWYEYEPAREKPVVEQASVKPEVKNEVGVDPAVKAFVKSYRGSRIDDEYLGYLSTYCDEKTLKNVIAISVAESGMGRDLPYRQSNFYGWFKGGNKNYDPDQETMAKEICRGVGTYYSELNATTAKRYTGNDRPTQWLRNVNWALDQMN